MKFSVDQKLFEKFPEMRIGILVALGIDNRINHEVAKKLLQSAIKSTSLNQPLAEHPQVNSWRQAFQAVGIDPNQFPPAHEALLKKFVVEKKPSFINPLVDVCNSTSVTNLVAIGAHDLDKLNGDIYVRPGKQGDTFQSIGSANQENVFDPVVYADAASVMTRNWIWRLGEHSKVTIDSRNVFIPIDVLPPFSEEKLFILMNELAVNLKKICGGQVISLQVNKNNPEVELPLFKKTVSAKKIDEIDRVLTRGVEQVLPSREGLKKLMQTKKIRLYLGIDPTATRLHLGHTVMLRKLQQFSDLGHEAILLFGTGTVLVGDPSQRATGRKLITQKEIDENIKTWKKQVEPIINFKKVKIKYNGDWLLKLGLKELIEIASKISAIQLFKREMFTRRLSAGDTVWYHETLYPLLQGYDSVAMNVDLELGGTDQTFNMLIGRELQDKMNHREKFVLAGKMIMGTDGKPMSKTSGNCIWLTDTAEDMFGKLMGVRDELMPQYFEFFTDQSMPNGEPLAVKKQLALTITAQYHGAAKSKVAQKYFEQTFQQKTPEFKQTIKLKSNFLETLLPITGSNSETKRLIQQKAIDLNNQTVTDFNQLLKAGDKLKVGKKKFYEVN